MRIGAFVLAVLLLLSSQSLTTSKADERNTVNISRITPVLFVQDVEPCVTFWVERFGFHKAAEVPDGDNLAFAMLRKGSVELMYQSYASADKDVGATFSQVARQGPTFLYVEVDNLDETITAVKGAEVVMPKRKTFYGSTEVGIRDPAGHYVTLAEFAAPTQP